jgi:hypothetical protein
MLDTRPRSDYTLHMMKRLLLFLALAAVCTLFTGCFGGEEAFPSAAWEPALLTIGIPHDTTSGTGNGGQAL